MVPLRKIIVNGQHLYSDFGCIPGHIPCACTIPVQAGGGEHKTTRTAVHGSAHGVRQATEYKDGQRSRLRPVSGQGGGTFLWTEGMVCFRCPPISLKNHGFGGLVRFWPGCVDNGHSFHSILPVPGPANAEWKPCPLCPACKRTKKMLAFHVRICYYGLAIGNFNQCEHLL